MRDVPCVKLREKVSHTIRSLVHLRFRCMRLDGTLSRDDFSVLYLHALFYSPVNSRSPMDFKPTLNLPDADATIPMKANLGALEPEIQAMWARENTYDAILAAHEDHETFLLHDGPPYTNGPIHMGTALNKILKDFVVKSQDRKSVV